MLTAPSTILSFPASAGFVFQDDELIFILVTSKDPGIRCERDLDLINAITRENLRGTRCPLFSWMRRLDGRSYGSGSLLRARCVRLSADG
jgi:hypothetical protein